MRSKKWNKFIVVVDNVSGMCKAGFSGDDSSRIIFPWIIERLKHTHKLWLKWDKKILTYKMKLNKKELIWIVNNCDEMEEIWHYTLYNELRVAPEEYPILLTKALVNPKGKREKNDTNYVRNI